MVGECGGWVGGLEGCVDWKGDGGRQTLFEI